MTPRGDALDEEQPHVPTGQAAFSLKASNRSR